MKHLQFLRGAAALTKLGSQTLYDVAVEMNVWKAKPSNGEDTVRTGAAALTQLAAVIGECCDGSWQ